MQTIDGCRFVLILTSTFFFRFSIMCYLSACVMREYGLVVTTQYEHYYSIIVFLYFIELQIERLEYVFGCKLVSTQPTRVRILISLSMCMANTKVVLYFFSFSFAFRFVRSRQLWASLLNAENILNGMLYEQINKEKSQPNPNGAKFENEKRNQRYLIHVEYKWYSYSKALIMYLLLFITILSFECQNYSMHRRTHTMSAHSPFFLIDWTSETGSSSIT